MSIVLDSSAALAFVYDDEMTPTISDLASMVEVSGAWVPSIWKLEVANSLQTSIRRRRIDVRFRDVALAQLAELAINTDPATDAHAWSKTLEFADRFGLTVYDSTYLELAARRALPLATLDHDLRDAARQSGLDVLPIG